MAFKKSIELNVPPQPRTIVHISITVYEAKQDDYPESEEEWNSYDGILIPGSFSCAYANDDWIEKLKGVIQSEIHAKCRKTLAVCFGHQIFAHSFHGVGSTDEGGLAIACPSGIQVGQRSFTLTHLRQDKWMNGSTISILYTHGDMVQSLPNCAVSLGGSATVPIQAAAYFASDSAQAHSETHPYAFTLQGHPEFATKTGVDTFSNIFSHMDQKGTLPSKVLMDAKTDAVEDFQTVEDDSVYLMLVIGKSFGWIPSY